MFSFALKIVYSLNTLFEFCFLNYFSGSALVRLGYNMFVIQKAEKSISNSCLYQLEPVRILFYENKQQDGECP